MLIGILGTTGIAIALQLALPELKSGELPLVRYRTRSAPAAEPGPDISAARTFSAR